MLHRTLFFAMVCGLALGVAGCGGKAAPEPASSTTTVAAAAAAAEVVSEMSTYTTALTAWFEDFEKASEAESQSAFEFADPLRPTDSEVARAREFCDNVRASLAELEQITTPDDVARAHSQLCSALRGEMAAVDRYISALDWQSQRDMELAYRQAEEAYALYLRAVDGLSPYVDLSDVIQN